MKYSKLITSFVLSASLLCTGAYANTLNEIQIDPDTHKTSISGNIERARGAKITVQILYPGVTDEDIKTVTNENFQDVFSNIFQVTADDNGNFTTPEYTLGSVSGKYGVRVMCSKSGSAPIMFDDAFLYISPDFNTDLLEALAGDKAQAETFIKKNIELILGDASQYALISDDEKAAAVSRAIDERESLENKKFSSAEQFTYALRTSVMLQRMLAAEDITTADSIFTDGLEQCNLTVDCTPVLLYRDKLKKESRQKILSQVLDNENIGVGEFVKEIGEKSLFAALSQVSNYANAEGILTANEKWMNADLTQYKKLKDKSAVNEAVVNADLKSVDELKKLIDTQVKKEKDSAGITSGSKGTGTAAPSSGSSVSAGFSPLATPSPTPSQKPAQEEAKAVFKDMGGFEWANEAVNTLCEHKIANGVSEDMFYPQRSVTREEFVKLLYTAFYGVPKGCKSGFDDVKDNDWFCPYVSAAAQAGLVNGISNEHFGAGQSITREDMAVMAYRFAAANGLNKTTDSTSVFDDSDKISSYALEAVTAMSAMGIIKGTGENRFSPSDFSNRAQAAQLVYALISKADGGEKQ